MDDLTESSSIWKNISDVLVAVVAEVKVVVSTVLETAIVSSGITGRSRVGSSEADWGTTLKEKTVRVIEVEEQTISELSEEKSRNTVK